VGGGPATWAPQIEGLSDAFTVIAWDGPGSGRSEDPPESFGMAGFADRLAEFIDELGLERPHVAGLSFGGALALELYRRHPEIPRTLILASAYAGWAGSLPPEEVDRRLNQVLDLADLPPERFVSAVEPTMFEGETPPDFFASLLEFHPAGLRAMARAVAEADLRDVLPQIDVPTLLLYGENDVRAPREVAEAIHAGIRDSRLVFLPAGHLCNIEAADRFNAEVRAFLQEA
jgi:pimeloyl-ACP methyl ester carboxylesterase